MLIELEFRDAVFDHPLTDERCAALFTFDPGKAAVEDATPRVRDNLAARAKQLTPAKP